ncbi:hypothetical protein IKE19_02370 [Candidatus Saccharibacteria bacterium]|nr:hypothetical protein [Candidatus Saccharibacteria bacterium]
MMKYRFAIIFWICGMIIGLGGMALNLYIIFFNRSLSTDWRINVACFFLCAVFPTQQAVKFVRFYKTEGRARKDV